MTTKEPKEPFISRWSRLKEEAKEQPAEKSPVPAAEQRGDPESAPPELPPLEKLTLDSDYRDFFHPKVPEDMRRAALKKLFSNPHFNIMDGLDVYIEDYSKPDPIPAAMLAGLKQAQRILEWARSEKREGEAPRAPAAQQGASAGSDAPAEPRPAPLPAPGMHPPEPLEKAAGEPERQKKS